MDNRSAGEFAHAWVESWNSHDLELIISHYSDDVILYSPMITRVMGLEIGFLQGKANLVDYWSRALEISRGLNFKLEEYFTGAGALTVVYQNQTGRRAAETFIFNDLAKVRLSVATYRLSDQ